MMRKRIPGMKNKLRILVAVVFIIFRWCITTSAFNPDAANTGKNASSNQSNQTNYAAK
jgi:hypothetical protein